MVDQILETHEWSAWAEELTSDIATSGFCRPDRPQNNVPCLQFFNFMCMLYDVTALSCYQWEAHYKFHVSFVNT